MKNALYIALIKAAYAASDAAWDYKQLGADWGETCQSGKKQSPIDLNDEAATKYGDKGNQGYARQDFSVGWYEVSEDLTEGMSATFGNGKYPNSSFKVSRDDPTTTPPAILEITDGDAWDLARYAPVQFHVHTPSEHTVNGKHQDLELHFVNVPTGDYAATKKDGEIDYAAFGIFFKSVDCGEKEGEEVLACEKELHRTDDIFEYMQVEALAAAANLKIKADELPNGKLPTVVDFSRILAISQVDTNKFWRYSGSVTTPPCAEPVRWTVLQDVLPMRKSYYDVIRAQYNRYNDEDGLGNNRAVQPLNDRKLMKVENTLGAVSLMAASAAVMSSFLLF